MKCPHCSEHFHNHRGKLYRPDSAGQTDAQDDFGTYSVSYCECSACTRLIYFFHHDEKERLILPPGPCRPLSPLIPDNYADSFQEAVAVLDLSPKASAALSRRCLQQLLTEHLATKSDNLAAQIQEVLDLRSLHSSLADALDAVRTIGNMAAHPIKAQHSGQIVEVEPGEAEWLLEVLEELFDHCFTKPQRLADRRNKLNEKLKQAGKPPLKSSADT